MTFAFFSQCRSHPASPGAAGVFSSTRCARTPSPCCTMLAILLKQSLSLRHEEVKQCVTILDLHLLYESFHLYLFTLFYTFQLLHYAQILSRCVLWLLKKHVRNLLLQSLFFPQSRTKAFKSTSLIETWRNSWKRIDTRLNFIKIKKKLNDSSLEKLKEMQRDAGCFASMF